MDDVTFFLSGDRNDPSLLTRPFVYDPAARTNTTAVHIT